MKRRPAAAMERPYAVLHKNLGELESLLHQLAAAANPDASPSNYKHQRSTCKDTLTGKIDFLKALLAAEMESHANDTPPHILHIGERLKACERAFRKWDDYNVLPEDGLHHHVSMCSCTDECFEEEAEREEEEEEEEDHVLEADEDNDHVPEPEDFGPVMDEIVEGSSAREEDGEAEQDRWFAGWRCRFISTAVAIAAAAAIGVAINFYRVVQEEDLLVPT